MFGSTVLEVAIGMVFVFLLVSLVCSGISDRISEILNWRAEHLENGIRDLLLGGDQKLLNKLYNNQVIQSLSTITAQKLHRTPPQTTDTPSSPVKPEDDGTQTPKCFPINIPKRTFVFALFNALVPNSSGQTTLDGLRDAINNMPQSAVKNELLTLVTGADSTIDGARKNVEQWFNAAEEEMTRLYKQKMWLVSLFIGLGVSVFLNIDTTTIASNLWHDPTLRAAVVAQATEYANQNISATGTISATQAISQTLDQINSLNLPMGWQVNRDKQKFVQCLVPANWVGFDWCLGPTDWVNWVSASNSAATSATSAVSFPWISSFIVKLIGWVITAFAGAQGAPFWFDILRKLTNKGSPAA